jgi:2-methylcitrate dehydratase PrpD
MKMSGITQELARFALETSWEDLPPTIIHETKRVIMDSIGCVIGALTIDKGKMYAALGRRYGGPPDASILGTENKTSLSTAALVNGELMFTLDFHTIMSGAHDGAYILPTLLAIAESVDASGKDLVLASALGFEISSRLAIAVGQHNATPRIPTPGEPLYRPGNAHSNLGAAAGASLLMKFDEEKMLHAMGMAGHLCQVMTKLRWGGGERSYGFKYGVPGFQSTGAVTAILLAEMGFTGDTTVLDDPKRGFPYFCGYTVWQPEKIMEEIGKTWFFTQGLHYKPYPCCGVFHGVLDCFYDIIEQNNLMPEEIESVKPNCMPGMYTGPNAIREIQSNISAAQFYPPYLFSLAAHRVRIGPEWHDKTTVRDPKIIKFMDKVTCNAGVPDPQMRTGSSPLNVPNKCEVVARGKTFALELDRSQRRGTLGSERAPTDDDIIGKFRHNAERILTQEKIDRAVEALVNLEKFDKISELIQYITL